MSHKHRYLICPGYITRGDTMAFVGHHELMQAYGVDPRECVVREWGDQKAYPEELIRLAPRKDGEYEVPHA